MKQTMFAGGLMVYILAIALLWPAREAVADEGPVCVSGGPGSTSCSITVAGSGCSVSCQPGFYACCGATQLVPGCTCQQ